MKMPKTKSGYNAIVAARDDLSGACEARAIMDGKSQTVANFFWEQIICRYGAVRQVTTWWEWATAAHGMNESFFFLLQNPDIFFWIYLFCIISYIFFPISQAHLWDFWL